MKVVRLVKGRLRIHANHFIGPEHHALDGRVIVTSISIRVICIVIHHSWRDTNNAKLLRPIIRTHHAFHLFHIEKLCGPLRATMVRF